MNSQHSCVILNKGPKMRAFYKIPHINFQLTKPNGKQG